jgi:hypothetical protein
MSAAINDMGSEEEAGGAVRAAVTEEVLIKLRL